MVDKVLLDYVEQVYVLESELYTLRKVFDNMRERCSQKRRQIEPENVSYTEPYGLKKEESSTGGKVMISIGVFVALGGLASASGIMVLYFVIAFLCIGYGVGRIKEVNGVIEDNARKRLEAEERSKEQLVNIKRRNCEIRTECIQLENTSKEFERLIIEKSKALEFMYNYDIIHRSYRNFYGVSKIYHLLDTGICDSLTGVDGAYSQMRMDQIIDNQKISIELQERILETNKMMYQAIHKTSELLQTLNQQIFAYNSSSTQLLNEIKNNVEVSNFLIQSANNDRKALLASTEYIAYAEKQKRLESGNMY